MEILRFEEAPTNAPKRKKSSRSFIALGFVATLFGVSTAFASSTITINNDAPIALGQGVSVFTTCDKFIGVNPVTALDSDLSKFKLTSVAIGTEYVSDPDVPIADRDNYFIDSSCNGTNFVVKFYQSPSTIPVNICTDDYKVTVPSAGSKYLCTSSGIYFEVSTTQHPILFGASIAPDFFDHISIETTIDNKF
jgi:hypothetical protein